MEKRVYCEECSKVFVVEGWQRRPYFCEETKACADAARDADRAEREAAQDRAAQDDWEAYR